MNETSSSLSEARPDAEESKQFWRDIWGKEVLHKENAEWLKELKKERVEPRQEDIVITALCNEFIPNNRGFKMACLNITSLSKHIDELRVLLQNNNLDLLAINETRLNETIADNEISISGYNIVRRDRPLNGRNGGGVCFYVRSNINYIVREDLVSDQLENLSFEIIKPRSKPFIVATWYRPPNSPFELFSTFEDQHQWL